MHLEECPKHAPRDPVFGQTKGGEKMSGKVRGLHEILSPPIVPVLLGGACVRPSPPAVVQGRASALVHPSAPIARKLNILNLTF